MERAELARESLPPAREPADAAAPNPVHVSSRPFVVGAASDPAEAQADAIADGVVAALEGGAPPSIVSLLNSAGSGGRVRRAAHGAPASFDLDTTTSERIRRASRGGEPLDASLRRSMGSVLGTSLDGVRVHRSAEAASLNRSLSARAFTAGSDVFFGAGEYRPGHSDGRHLIAHEVAHVVQAGGQVRRRTESEVIHRKLAGSHNALRTMAGDASLPSKGKAAVARVKTKVVGSLDDEGSGKYAQILWLLKAYESKESSLYRKGGNMLKPRDRNDLVKQLGELIQLCETWLEQNKDQTVSNAAAAQSALELQGLFANEFDALSSENQKRRKKVAKRFPRFQESSLEQQTEMAAAISRDGQSPVAKRYRAIKLLLPRLRHEVHVIERGDFYRDEMYSDTTLDQEASEDNWNGGKVNRLDRVEHATREGGSETGVFIEDKTWQLAGTVGNTMGISSVDPGAGARSVAMYQLAKLLDLGVDVIAKTDFATHSSTTGVLGAELSAPESRLGIRMQMASGTAAATIPTERSAAQATAQGGDTISLEDPVLQRSLNALQLIDAIAGQLDRHWKNYYIATDGQGRVTGVIGIDLDMAFAPDHRGIVPSQGGDDPLKDSHFVGMPHLVDSEFAQKIVAVSILDVKRMLERYLEPADVDSTIHRLTLVRDACRAILAAPAAGRIVNPDAWGAGTAALQAQDSSSSYVGKMAAGHIEHKFRKPMEGPVYGTVTRQSDRRLFDRLLDDLGRLLAQNTVAIPDATHLAGKMIETYTRVPEESREEWLTRLGRTPVSSWNDGVTDDRMMLEAAALAPFP